MNDWKDTDHSASEKRLSAEHNKQIGIIKEPGGICPPGSFVVFTVKYRNFSSFQQVKNFRLLSPELFRSTDGDHYLLMIWQPLFLSTGICFLMTNALYEI